MANQPQTRAWDIDEQFVQELAWKMLDDCIDEEEAEQLDLLLTHSASARAVYVQIVQLHVDLLDHFDALPKAGDLLKQAMAQPPTQPLPPIAPAADGIVTTEPTGA